MLDRRILGRMPFYLHKVEFHLQRCITQQADKVRFRRNLQRHQVQHDNPQRANVLFGCTQRVHHKDVLLLQQLNGW